jgi:hypothetical protein
MAEQRSVAEGEKAQMLKAAQRLVEEVGAYQTRVATAMQM